MRIASEISGLFEIHTPVIRGTVTVTRDSAFRRVKYFFFFFPRGQIFGHVCRPTARSRDKQALRESANVGQYL